MSTKTHTINLNNGARALMRTLLQGVGWCRDVATLSRAGSIVELPEMDFEAPKIESEWIEWARETIAIELTEKQRDAAKACVGHFAKEGRLGGDKHVLNLLRELGLYEE